MYLCESVIYYNKTAFILCKFDNFIHLGSNFNETLSQLVMVTVFNHILFSSKYLPETEIETLSLPQPTEEKYGSGAR